MGKSLASKNLFDDNPLERAESLIVSLKKDKKEMESGLKSQYGNLEETQFLLLEIKKRIAEMGQPDLFQRMTIAAKPGGNR